MDWILLTYVAEDLRKTAGTQINRISVNGDYFVLAALTGLSFFNFLAFGLLLFDFVGICGLVLLDLSFGGDFFFRAFFV